MTQTPNHHRIAFAAIFLWLLGWTAVALGDTVILKDGGKLTGTVLGRSRDPVRLFSGKYLVVRTARDTSTTTPPDTAKAAIDTTQSDSTQSKPDSSAARKQGSGQARARSGARVSIASLSTDPIQPDTSGTSRDTSTVGTRESQTTSQPKAAMTVEAIRLETIQLVVIDDPDTVRVYDVDAIAAASRASSVGTFAIGASLDFLKGVSASDVFYSLSVLSPDMFYDYRALPRRQFRSYMARVFPSGYSLKFEQGRSASQDSVVESSRLVAAATGERVGQVIKRSRTTDFSTLAFSLYWPLWRRESPSIRTFVVIQNEFRRIGFERRVTITREDSAGSDSGGARIADSKDEVRERLMSFGAGIIADLSDISARVFVGWSNQQERTKFGVYMIQAVVRENRYGLTVIGEVRGLQAPEVIREDPRRFPEYAVSVSKTFALDKLGDFLAK